MHMTTASGAALQGVVPSLARPTSTSRPPHTQTLA